MVGTVRLVHVVPLFELEKMAVQSKGEAEPWQRRYTWLESLGARPISIRLKEPAGEIFVQVLASPTLVPYVALDAR